MRRHLLWLSAALLGAAITPPARAEPGPTGEAKKQPSAERREDQKTRADRRRKAVAAIRARWGALVTTPAARTELELHARRMAKLEAMAKVARTSGKEALLPRIEGLRVKEEARHTRKMDYLRNERDGG